MTLNWFASALICSSALLKYYAVCPKGENLNPLVKISPAFRVVGEVLIFNLDILESFEIMSFHYRYLTIFLGFFLNVLDFSFTFSWLDKALMRT